MKRLLCLALISLAAGLGAFTIDATGPNPEVAIAAPPPVNEEPGGPLIACTPGNAGQVYWVNWNVYYVCWPNLGGWQLVFG